MARPHTPETSSDPALRHSYWIIILVTAVTAWAFWPSLGNDFVDFDDYEYVVQNPWIRAWTWSNLRAIWTHSLVDNYHPLVFMTHLLEYRLWGLNPAGYHAVNLALHLLATIGVFACVRQLGFTLWVSGVTALWFGVHPLHVESVAWIAERKDVLCAAGYLLALWLYLRARQHSPGRFPTGAFLVYLLALLSKPMAVTWPLLTMLCDWWQGRKPDPRWWREKALFLVPAVILSLVTWLIQSEEQGIRMELVLKPWQNVMTACWGLFFYLGKLLIPLHLSALYPRPAWEPALPWTFVAAPLLLAVMLAGIWRWKSRPRVVLLGLGWYFLTLIPVSGIVPIGMAVAADRYMYLPSVGPLLLVAAGLDQLRTRWRASSPPVWGVVGLASLLLVMETSARSAVWKNSETLWVDTVRASPQSVMAHYNLGVVRFRQGNYPAAEAQYRQALALDPHHRYSMVNLGVTLRYQGRLEEAAAALQQALAAYPSDPAALEERRMVLGRLHGSKNAPP